MSTNQANQKAMQNLEGESTEPKVLDGRVRQEMNRGLCEYPVALMLTDAGEVSKEKRRYLKRVIEATKLKQEKEKAKATSS